jgi:plastocyanin
MYIGGVVADFQPRVSTNCSAATSEMRGTTMTFQRRDAIKSLISVGLIVATPAGAQAKRIEISMTDSAFVPPNITINAGDEVIWKNPALLLHTVTFDPAEAADKSNIKLPTGVQPFGSADLSEDGTFTHVFMEKGTYNYVCKYHESMGMKGTVIVS